MGGYYTYEKVQDSDLEEQVGFDAGLPTRKRQASSWSCNLLSHLAAIITGALVCFVALKWRGYWFQHTCADAKLQISSVVPEELTKYSERVQFNGTLGFPSIYRGSFEEVDDAWRELIELGFMDVEVTEDDVHALGVDPETVARFPENQGGSYIATIEYTHQLHCLDMLRRITPWNYPEHLKSRKQFHAGGETPHTMELFRTHTDHCIEMLRQVLMCHADTTPILEQWVSVRGHPWPNFNTVHQCRNFEAIHEWTKAHTKDLAVEWPTRPDGAKALATPP